jgi:hypothetical protein
MLLDILSLPQCLNIRWMGVERRISRRSAVEFASRLSAPGTGGSSASSSEFSFEREFLLDGKRKIK